ncbi:hypothetical protein SH2C18_18960 [Clostridium sediminicola]|uniref:competence protein CoiA n=1 Tax=Clostridium sediminicola TaxID=3114879 RepID=UPI0031F1CAA3
METCLYKGKHICAYDVTNVNYALNYELKKQWRIAGRNGELLCSECGMEVLLRANDPRKRVPHFSHKAADYKCPFSHNNLRESENHKKAKMILYHYFKEKYPEIQPIINHRFPNRRRADLYMEFSNGDKLAVEYQRTQLDLHEWQGRHKDYKKANINVLWLIGGNEKNVKTKEKQVEVTFFQQIMLNEEEKVAVYLDVDNSKIVLAKNMRYSDPYNNNNDFEELYIKVYNLNDIGINSKGFIECDFIEEYKKVNKEFEDEHCNKCILQKKEIDESLEVNSIDDGENKRDNFFDMLEEIEEKTITYFSDYAPYKNKIKHILNGDERQLEEVAMFFRANGNSNHFKFITAIFKYNYLYHKNEEINEIYTQLMDKAGLGYCELEIEEKSYKKLVCPICKGVLKRKYGNFGAVIQCSNYPVCKVSFNVDLEKQNRE